MLHVEDVRCLLSGRIFWGIGGAENKRIGGGRA
jgi:hypothetical protein